jgi:hypothetical protein
MKHLLGIAVLAAGIVSGPSGTRSQAPEQNQPPPSASSSSQPPSRPVRKKLRKRRRPTKAGPRKVVVPDGSTSEEGGSLSPALSGREAELQRSSTDQLLKSSDESLKALSGRQLSPEQEDTVQQVNAYMQQSRAAADEGDVQRAHNLALKARLLADTLRSH